MSRADAHEFVSVYMTAGSLEDALALARALVEEGLAACVNVLPEAVSVYRWQGTVQTEAEVVLLAKTRAALFADLAARVRQLHEYDVPCIVALPLADGDDGYLSWLAAQTRAD
jgi:periplasmic divalent cation tolerance protein